MNSAAILQTSLQEGLPVESPWVELPGATMRLSLHLAPSPAGDSAEEAGIQEDASGCSVLLRLIAWERNHDGNPQIHTVFEQTVLALPRSFQGRDPEILLAWILAWLELLPEVMAGALRERSDNFSLLPHELLCFRSHPLSLKKASTKEDFLKALSRPSRLGRWL